MQLLLSRGKQKASNTSMFHTICLERICKREVSSVSVLYVASQLNLDQLVQKGVVSPVSFHNTRIMYKT
jgi:hypothetical protein